MGRPLQVRQEKKEPCARAVRIGEAGSIAGVPELLALSKHSRATVRRSGYALRPDFYLPEFDLYLEF